MIQLSTPKNLTKYLSIDLGEAGKLDVEHRPSAACDPAPTRSILELPKDAPTDVQLDTTINWLKCVLAWWDLYDNEVPMAITAESLKSLPMWVLNEIILAISNDMSDNQPSGKVVVFGK